MAQKLPPIYKNSFVGIWKRMFVSGRPQAKFQPLIFNQSGVVSGPIGPGSRIGGGVIKEIRQNPDVPEKGEIIVLFGPRKTPVSWTYTLNRNNHFKAEFNPINDSNKVPPVLNELLLVGQGARHLYAFFSHPFKRVMIERDILQYVEP